MAEDLTQIATFTDEMSAEILAGMLRSEGVPTEVRPISPLPGIVDEVQVFVPSSLAHRARRLMNSSKTTDDELQFIATGELGEDDGKS
jgi:hypothetical protein